MSADGEYVFNPNVQVGNVRTIAVRGLTPNHIGATFSALDGYYSGSILSYQHNIDAGTTDVELDTGAAAVKIKLQTMDIVKVFA